MMRKSWLVEVDFEKLFHHTTLFLSPSNDEKGKKVCIELGFPKLYSTDYSTDCMLACKESSNIGDYFLQNV
jgi:hypothetical protein